MTATTIGGGIAFGLQILALALYVSAHTTPGSGPGNYRSFGTARSVVARSVLAGGIMTVAGILYGQTGTAFWIVVLTGTTAGVMILSGAIRYERLIHEG